MEILIPGLILVGFMVWASTRIKRNAAAAFEAEVVEKDEFVLRKPEGFLHVLSDESDLAFRSYSREFGKVGEREVRRATIEVERHSSSEVDGLQSLISSRAETVDSVEPYIDGGERATWILTTEIVEGGQYSVVRKLVTRGSTVWEARATFLSEYNSDLGNILETAIDSFRLK